MKLLLRLSSSSLTSWSKVLESIAASPFLDTSMFLSLATPSVNSSFARYVRKFPLRSSSARFWKDLVANVNRSMRLSLRSRRFSVRSEPEKKYPSKSGISVRVMVMLRKLTLENVWSMK
jgi:hypothetical protein